MTPLKDPVLKAGTHIGVYEIKRLISVDRSGFIYSAWNEHLNTQVTVKEYFPADFAVRSQDGASVAAKSAEEEELYHYGLKNFLRLGDKLSEIHHPSIVGIHNVLKFNNTAYLIMDQIQGVAITDLHEAASDFTESELNPILASVLEALQQVHSKGLAHGDLFPGNLLIRANGLPVLVNFAAERLVFATQSNVLLQDIRAGYTAPELYNPNNLPGPASDLYSLGATLYRCITGIEPCSAEERKRAIDKNEADPLKPLAVKAGDRLSEAFIALIERLLETDIEQRPQSVAALLSVYPQPVEHASTDAQTGIPTDLAATKANSRPSYLLGRAVAIAALIAAGFWYLQLDKQGGTPFTPTPETASSSASVDKQRPEPAAEAESGQIRSETPEAPLGAATATSGSMEAPQTETIASTEPEIKSTDQPSPAADVPADNESSHITSSEPDETIGAVDSEPKDAMPVTPALQAPVKSPRQEQPEPGLISQHLAQAEKDIAALRLTTPKEKSAYLQYQAVLKMDPQNKEAHDGLRRIVDKYIWLIKKSISANQLDRARRYLGRAETVLPGDPSLKPLHEEISTAQQSIN